MNDNLTPEQAKALREPNVARVKHIYGYGPERRVRLYIDDFDGNACSVEYDDPQGAIYDAFKMAGVYAS